MKFTVICEMIRQYYLKKFYNYCMPIDLSPYNQNFDLGKSRQIIHHSLKEHDKISNIAKFRCEML